MTSFKDRVVFITGASSGIGRACAKSFAALGAKLLLGARRIERLETLAQDLKKEHDVAAYPIRIDVRDYKELENILSRLPEEWKTVDLLINSAGLGLRQDKMYEANPEHWDTMIDTNVKGMLYVTRLILPGMVERKKGHIINIGSIAAYDIYPGGSVYCASKTAIRTLSQGMRMDLLDKSIRVTNINPGMTKTEFASIRWGGDPEFVDKLFQGVGYLLPEDVADVVVFCATRPPHVNIGELLVTPTDQVSFLSVHRKAKI